MQVGPFSIAGRYTYRGRKKALVENQVVELRRRAGAGEPKALLAREFGISRETLYQYLKVMPAA
ncbi:helix-turn-helix domain-containing protein [Janthinobacterium sp. LB3P118]|uniref:helix-turn-helix domain-containing protein n=1 Tax=Janthinobacterium sp. LB3P118 TaxID=3424195 RepID=UPI003F29E07C